MKKISKQDNAITGTQFEAAVVKCLDKRGVVQWTKSIDPEIMKDGKRPDYLIAFSKSSGKASIFNCQNYKANDSDEIQFRKLTDNRYTIGNSNVEFAFQYAWGGGAGIKNPVIRVFLQH